MSRRFIARILGAVALGLALYQLGRWIALDTFPKHDIAFALSGAALGIALGLLLTPTLTIMPFNALRRRLTSMAISDLVAVATGLIVGLVLSALLTVPLRALPNLLGNWMPIVAAIAICYICINIAAYRHRELAEFFQRRSMEDTDPPPAADLNRYLLDTSTIIDGRIVEVADTGFLHGTLVVPRFVLRELQLIADSADSLRRARGRRGLDVLSQLQTGTAVTVQVEDFDLDTHEDVDGKLLILGQQCNMPIITNDYNLNKVAVLQGIRILNINELAHALRPIVLPGEELKVHIVQEGKELDQGVGYLEDGTMVVVENGRRYIDSEINVQVTRLLQTTAGRMIFAQVAMFDPPQLHHIDRVQG